MIRPLFVDLLVLAALDVLRALRDDLPAPATAAALRRAWGPRPAAASLATGAGAGALGALGAAWAAGQGLSPALPLPGTVALALVAAVRLGPALRGADTAAAVPGVLLAAGPAFGVSAALHAGGALAGRLAATGPDAEVWLVGSVLPLLAQLAWSLGLTVALLSTRRRWWLLAWLEPALAAAAVAGAVAVAREVGDWGAALGRGFVVLYVDASVAAVFDLVADLADVGLAVWGVVWALAASWLVAGEVVPAGRAPERIPGWDTARWLAVQLRDLAGGPLP